MAQAIVRLGELRIPTGQVYQVPEGTALILVDSIVVEDDARIVVSSGTELLSINAKKAFFGKNTLMNARGVDGGSGQDGGNGTPLHLFFGNMTFGGTTVDTQGGTGGHGQKGAKGAHGHGAECSGSDATNGGPGEKGGTGGVGGKGGDIKIRYVSAGSLKLLLRPEGGHGGAPGDGGDGGDAGAGHTHCGIWPYWSKGSGYNGASGPQGEEGADGPWGDYDLQQVGEDLFSTSFAELIKTSFPREMQRDILR